MANQEIDPSWKNQESGNQNLESLMLYLTQLNSKIQEFEQRITALGG